jgi:hypothetical protein
VNDPAAILRAMSPAALYDVFADAANQLIAATCRCGEPRSTGVLRNSCRRRSALCAICATPSGPRRSIARSS